MAKWGDIASGAGIGLRDVVRTYADLQRIRNAELENEINRNKFNLMQKEQQRKDAPIYLDRIKSVLEPEEFDYLRKLAMPMGIVSKDAMGNEYVRTEFGEKFMSSLTDDHKAGLATARLKASERKEGELTAALEKASDKDRDAITAKLAEQKKQTDQLRYGIDSYVKKQEADRKEREARAHELTASATFAKALRESKWTHSGTTERGGLPVWENPETMEMVVRKSTLGENGQVKYINEPYDPAKHGRLLGKTLSQTTIINQREKEKKEAQGFRSWTPEAKESEFMLHAITGKPPVNAAGLAGNERQIYAKEYAQWKVNKGMTPQMIAAMQADFRAKDASLKNMTKQEAPMNAFVMNINKQISKLEQVFAEADRTGIRAADWTMRQVRTKAKGSGNEAVIASYLMEISSEIGKLSTGASASIQQLGERAREDWNKVHDPNLSWSEISKVLNATRDQANMRMSTWRDAKNVVRGELGMMGVEAPVQTPGRFKVDPSKVRFR